MRKGRRIALSLVTLLLMPACNGQLDHLGRPPSMTAPKAYPQPAESQAAKQPSNRTVVAPQNVSLRYGPQASLWQNGPKSLFGDRRAQAVGDILTVVIEIDDEASIRNATARNRSGSEAVDVTALLGLDSEISRQLPGDATLNPAIGATGSSVSSGDGSTRRNEEITLKIAATVTDVLPNGHLVISGSQEIRVNFELRDLRIDGIIRSEDISRRNTIGYEKIAEARIVYGGRGQITDLQQPRYGQQVIEVLSPF